MGAVFPEEKSAFFSMITGTVDELYAYSHHFKWWREVKVAQSEWEQRHDRETRETVDPVGAIADAGGSGPEDRPETKA
jgi:hypothetical protein